MPLKDITNEEKSNLYMVGRKPKESAKITENERGIQPSLRCSIANRKGFNPPGSPPKSGKIK